jgi:NAD(P)-dependent dehydrogenase (short-subunit alcohol dehydrogenase family)
VRATALAAQQVGATVILLGKTIAKLEAVYDEIENTVTAHGEKCSQPAIYPLKLGGATMQDYETMHDALDKEFGRLDGLLHNASILGQRKSILDTSLSDWNDVLNVNLTSQFMLTKALLPLLKHFGEPTPFRNSAPKRFRKSSPTNSTRRRIFA